METKTCRGFQSYMLIEEYDKYIDETVKTKIDE
jgi:hypothetical protein